MRDELHEIATKGLMRLTEVLAQRAQADLTAARALAWQAGIAQARAESLRDLELDRARRAEDEHFQAVTDVVATRRLAWETGARLVDAYRESLEDAEDLNEMRNLFLETQVKLERCEQALANTQAVEADWIRRCGQCEREHALLLAEVRAGRALVDATWLSRLTPAVTTAEQYDDLALAYDTARAATDAEMGVSNGE